MPGDLEFKVAIIGAGKVGSGLARALAAKGHTILFGVRNPSSDKTRAALALLRDKAVVTNIPDAIVYGDLIVLAVGWPDAAEIIRSLADHLKGKILIDTTNLFGDPTHDGRSGAEILAELAPEAQVVKCFNTIGSEHFTDPIFNDKPASMYLCGDDAEAKTFVGWLVSDLGFELVDAGPLSNAGALEAMGRLWVYLSKNGMGRDFAFKLVKK